jgi:hypothetical protein
VLEVDVDLSLDRRERFMRDLDGPHYVKGTEVTFRVPYQGDRDAFYCRPSTYTLNPPYAEIEDEALLVRVVRRDQNAAEFRKSFDGTIAQIQQALEQLRRDCAGLDEALRSTATAQLAKRCGKRERDRGLLDGLGFGRSKR